MSNKTLSQRYMVPDQPHRETVPDPPSREPIVSPAAIAAAGLASATADEGGTRRVATHDDDDPRWAGFEKKTLWDWLQMLVVPLMLVLVGVGFAWQQDARQDATEARRAERERTVEDQRAQDTALQAYLDQMSGLMIGEESLRDSQEGSAVRTLARARTATIVQRLDAERNQSVLLFLGEAGFLGGEPQSEGSRSEDEPPPISFLSRNDLQGAALSGADLSGADLSSAHLTDAIGVTRWRLEEQTSMLEGAIMPDGSKHP